MIQFENGIFVRNPFLVGLVFILIALIRDLSRLFNGIYKLFRDSALSRRRCSFLGNDWSTDVGEFSVYFR